MRGDHLLYVSEYRKPKRHIFNHVHTTSHTSAEAHDMKPAVSPSLSHDHTSTH